MASPFSIGLASRSYDTAALKMALKSPPEPWNTVSNGVSPEICGASRLKPMLSTLLGGFSGIFVVESMNGPLTFMRTGTS